MRSANSCKGLIKHQIGNNHINNKDLTAIARESQEKEDRAVKVTRFVGEGYLMTYT
jgi:hypothetical protein